MKEEKKVVKVEDLTAKAAERLDKVLCKYGMSNGIVTAANFSVVRNNVTLQGAELSKVGTGYAATGETIAAKLESIVDAVESELEKVAEGKPAVSKSEQKRIDAQKEVEKTEEEEETEEEGEQTETADGESTEGEEGEVEIEDVDNEPTVKELTEVCKKRGIKVPRGATKKVLINLIEADKAGK